MAIIRTETIYCLKQEFKRVIRYQSRYSEFFITLPASIPEKEVSGKTEKEVIERFDAAVAIYEKAITETSKVILYRYEVDAYIFGPDAADDDDSTFFNSQDNCEFGKTFTDDGITLKLWAAVYEKAEVVLDGADNYINYEEIESPIPESLEPKSTPIPRWGEYQEIPWTPENEQFFIDIGRSFEQLIFKLNLVLGNGDSVVKFIASGQKLLPTLNQEIDYAYKR